jgi:hypothetical protein
LFCRSEFEPENASIEHLIPEALGGWIKNRLPCTPCNNKLGTEVDSISGVSPLFQLRAEAGLKPAPIKVTYRTPGVDIPLEAKLTADGDLIDTRNVYGRGQLIVDRTAEKVQQRSESINEGRRKRGEPEFVGGTPQNRPAGAALVRVEATPMDVATLRLKLSRLAAKMAIEHIAMTSSREEALRADLDSLREFALNGSGDPQQLGIQVGALSGKYWLPATEEVLLLNQAIDAASEPEQKKQPDDSTRIESLNHVLVFSVNDRGCLFSVLLFGLIQLNVPLPCGLDLPWGKTLARDLLTGKEPAKSLAKL